MWLVTECTVWCRNRCMARRDCNPPDYPPRRLLIIVYSSVNWVTCSTESGNLFASAPSAACSSCTHMPINRKLLLIGLWLHFSPHAEISWRHKNSSNAHRLEVDFAHKNNCRGNIPWASLRTTNFRSFIYSHSSIASCKLGEDRSTRCSD